MPGPAKTDPPEMGAGMDESAPTSTSGAGRSRVPVERTYELSRAPVNMIVGPTGGGKTTGSAQALPAGGPLAGTEPAGRGAAGAHRGDLPDLPARLGHGDAELFQSVSAVDRRVPGLARRPGRPHFRRDPEHRRHGQPHPRRGAVPGGQRPRYRGLLSRIRVHGGLAPRGRHQRRPRRDPLVRRQPGRPLPRARGPARPLARSRPSGASGATPTRR